MIEKFIEGTDNRYSITSEGRIFSHYRYNNNGKVNYRIREVIINKMNNIGSVNIIINGKNYCTTIKTLMLKIFNERRCTNCKNLFTQSDKEKRRCKDCRKLMENLKQKRNIKKMSRSYIAACLNIKLQDLDDNLYNHAKKTLAFKRKLVEEHNLNINALIK